MQLKFCCAKITTGNKGEHKMNMSLLKVISILSCFIGAVCGFLSVLPYIGSLAFLILLCFSAVIVIIFLMRVGALRLESVPESITIGGIVGFISFLVFSLIYMPLVIILVRVFHYSSNYGVAIFLRHANIFVVIVCAIFLAILSATINAFSGFLIYYITETINNLSKK